MALNKKNNGFGFDMEERFQRVTAKQEQLEYGYTHTDTDAHTHADTDPIPPQKENRTKRLYLLCQPSVHQKIDAYAKQHSDTFNNVVHKMMEEFISTHNL